MRRSRCLPLLLLAAASCGGAELGNQAVEASLSAAPGPAPSAAVAAAAVQLAAPQPLESTRLHHLLRLSELIYSGSLPVGDEAFAELAALGVKTVVGVDGARPDVETAARHGLAYVHIPIRYDGLAEEAVGSLVRLMAEGEGPFYFHCHHGRHRGPAAAAVALRASTGCGAEAAKAVLVAAGTSPDYPGLWRDVAAFVPPAPGVTLPELHEVAVVADFTAGMAAIDRDWDDLKALRAASWSSPAEHPDLDLRRSTQAFAEHFADASAAQSPEQSLDPVLQDQMQQAQRWANALRDQAEASSRPPSEAQAAAMEELFRELRSSCKDCHRDYRDGGSPQ